MSNPLPAPKPKRVIQALKRGGFPVHHITGSRYILKHADDATLQ